MLRILFDLPRSSVLNKDLLLHVNPSKTLKNVHTKPGIVLSAVALKPVLNRSCLISGQAFCSSIGEEGRAPDHRGRDESRVRTHRR